MTVQALLYAENGVQIPCAFNPSTMTVEKSTGWTSQAIWSRDAPNQTYTGGASATTTLDLLFDTRSDGKPVSEHTSELAALLQIDSTLKAHVAGGPKGRPPWVQLRWGRFSTFKAVATDMSVEYTYFGPDGTPLRAKVKLGLTQFEDGEVFGKQNPTSGTVRPHRVHQVTTGERLEMISQRYYQDPSMWRSIAEANRIDDPFALSAGRLLTIPDQLDAADG